MRLSLSVFLLSVIFDTEAHYLFLLEYTKNLMFKKLQYISPNSFLTKQVLYKPLDIFILEILCFCTS